MQSVRQLHNAFRVLISFGDALLSLWFRNLVVTLCSVQSLVHIRAFVPGSRFTLLTEEFRDLVNPGFARELRSLQLRKLFFLSHYPLSLQLLKPQLVLIKLIRIPWLLSYLVNLRLKRAFDHLLVIFLHPQFIEPFFLPSCILPLPLYEFLLLDHFLLLSPVQTAFPHGAVARLISRRCLVSAHLPLPSSALPLKPF
jgi:hypothetical protein